MQKLVLWGHGLDEYEEMFDLPRSEMKPKILEYGCGPSAVNAELTKENQQVVSCDPLFTLDKDTLYSKCSLVFDEMLNEVHTEKEKFELSKVGQLDRLVKKRKAGMDTFFSDYEDGKEAHRYIGMTGYELPFDDFNFEYALSSHYFFAGLDNQDVEFHVKIIGELCRVAKELRIFPLINRTGQTSPLLGPVLLDLQNDHFGSEIREVPYHLQKHGNAMLRVWAQECKVK